VAFALATSGYVGQQIVRPPAEGKQPVVSFAIRPITHVAAWLVWHSTHVSLLSDLEAPAPPYDARRSEAA
jgi:hypothetical protein